MTTDTIAFDNFMGRDETGSYDFGTDFISRTTGCAFGSWYTLFERRDGFYAVFLSADGEISIQYSNTHTVSPFLFKDPSVSQLDDQSIQNYTLTVATQMADQLDVREIRLSAVNWTAIRAHGIKKLTGWDIISSHDGELHMERV